MTDRNNGHVTIGICELNLFIYKTTLVSTLPHISIFKMPHFNIVIFMIMSQWWHNHSNSRLTQLLQSLQRPLRKLPLFLSLQRLHIFHPRWRHSKRYADIYRNLMQVTLTQLNVTCPLL